MPTPPPQSTLQLRVELDEVTPTVWREILVPTGVRMSRLHDMIRAAMGWTNSHLHAFTVTAACSNHLWTTTLVRISGRHLICREITDRAMPSTDG